MSGALIVGYGNVLRTDDGVGWYAATALAASGRLPGAVINATHQLTPELALDVSTADLVVLIDAGHDMPAGEFSIGRAAATGRGAPSSHILDPGDLADLARTLYGRAPEIVVVSVGVTSVEVGQGLTAMVEAGLPALVDAVVELVHGAVAEPAGA